MRTKIWLLPALLLLAGLATILVLSRVPVSTSSSDDAGPQPGTAARNPS